MTELLKISLPDGSVREVPAGSTPADIAAAIGPGLAKAALAARVDGELRDLTRPFDGDAELALVTARDEADALIARLTEARAAEIAAGTAPDDLATKIMVTPDPLTGDCFQTAEMVDQVAIFFLAGHETSASALAWALLMLALYPQVQEQVAAEAAALGDTPDFAALSKLIDVDNRDEVVEAFL